MTQLLLQRFQKFKFFKLFSPFGLIKNTIIIIQNANLCQIVNEKQKQTLLFARLHLRTMSCHNILTVEMSREAQEVELLRRFSKLVDRLERTISELFPLFSIYKLNLLSAKCKRGGYFLYDVSDRKQKMLQLDWIKFESDLRISMFENCESNTLYKQIYDDIMFESERQYSERIEELRKDKMKYLEVSLLIV
jgi:hypothetical protein